MKWPFRLGGKVKPREVTQLQTGAGFGDDVSAYVIELAKKFMEFMRNLEPDFSRAYYRFAIEPSRYGANGSYQSGDLVHLISAFDNEAFFQSMNELSRSLVESLSKNRGVFLLSIESTFDYKIDFDWVDLDRWRITKLDGASGLPIE